MPLAFMIARVSLELALRKEFDYLIPPELEGQVEVGSRVQVPFGKRNLMGCVTGLAEESDRPQLKPIDAYNSALIDELHIHPELLDQ